MIQELQTNRIVLEELEKCYGMFRFTGGVVPRTPWDIVAVTSYLKCPFAPNCISTKEAERYRYLAETIMDLGEEVTTGERPRTIRRRHDISDRFSLYASEVRTLEGKLESDMMKLVAEMESTPLLS